MLRGSQTPGELKQRTERLHRFASLEDVERTLDELIARELVERLPRRPGQKEERYRHLLGDGENGHGETAPVSARPVLGPDPETGLEERVARLEREVAALREELDRLR